MAAFLVVRAEVPEGERAAFDRWYRDEHLPDALAAFQARAAWRGWSDADPGVHYAFYEFESLARAREVTGSDAIKGLVAEFDRRWGDSVSRTREVIESRQRLEGSKRAG